MCVLKMYFNQVLIFLEAGVEKHDITADAVAPSSVRTLRRRPAGPTGPHTGLRLTRSAAYQGHLSGLPAPLCISSMIIIHVLPDSEDKLVTHAQHLEEYLPTKCQSIYHKYMIFTKSHKNN